MTSQPAQLAPGPVAGATKKAVVPMSGLINGVIVRITLRATLGRKRALLLALPASS